MVISLTSLHDNNEMDQRKSSKSIAKTGPDINVMP